MNINRIEFLVTYDCTSNCKHCSVIGKLNCKKSEEIKPELILEALSDVSLKSNIESILTFGGEPLLN